MLISGYECDSVFQHMCRQLSPIFTTDTFDCPFVRNIDESHLGNCDKNTDEQCLGITSLKVREVHI